MKTLAELLVKLSVDPALRRRFKEDPLAFFQEAELSDEEMALLAGGTPNQIRDHLGGASVEDFLLHSEDDPV
jgi:hypothetical protein